MLVVFATNIRPSELVDEAFLRRIHYKVFAENPTVADFKKIFERCCATSGVSYEEAVVDHLLQTCTGRGIPLRGCHPRDLIDQALSLGRLPGPTRHPHRPAAEGGVRQLLRRRARRVAGAGLGPAVPSVRVRRCGPDGRRPLVGICDAHHGADAGYQHPHHLASGPHRRARRGSRRRAGGHPGSRRRGAGALLRRRHAARGRTSTVRPT